MIFDKDCSENYDQYWTKLSVLNDALHLLTRIIFSELPEDAHILCVGAGTGEDILGLAGENPGWRFTAVDPSVAMLEMCKDKLQKEGIASRCIFHADYLESLPEKVRFNGATSFLVSHFFTDPDKRRALFQGIGSRLVRGGLLVTADFSADITDPDFGSLLELWLSMMRYANLADDEIEGMRLSLSSSNGAEISLLPPLKIEEIINSVGFSRPNLFFKSALIHAWYSRYTNL